MSDYNELKKAYEDISKTIDVYYDLIPSIVKQHIDPLKKLFLSNLRASELRHVYGFDVEENQTFYVGDYSWFPLDDNASIYTVAKVDGKIDRCNNFPPSKSEIIDVNSEVMMVLSFPYNSAYISSLNPNDLFNQFWEELKNLNPKYVNEDDFKLYYTLEEGAKVYNEYKRLTEKYRSLAITVRLRHELTKSEERTKELKAKLNKNK